MKKVKFTLDTVGDAIKEIRAYRKWLIEKTTQLNERLAMIGTEEASRRFGAAIYDGVNDVALEATAKDDGSGWVITASGEAVCFIEFGAGVYHNSGEPYPNPRPPGIVPIGEYGQGKGKRRGWMYFAGGDEKVFTRGNPAAMPMYFASEAMKRELENAAREVFSHN